MPNISRSAERLIFVIILSILYVMNQQSNSANINQDHHDQYSSADPIPSTKSDCNNDGTQRDLGQSSPNLEIMAPSHSLNRSEMEVIESTTDQGGNATDRKWVKDRLVIHLGKEHFYWHYGQRRLCQMLQDMTLTGEIQQDPKYFRDPIPGRPIPKLVTELNCNSIRGYFGFGEGNWVSAVYSSRMAAARAKVDYSFSCRSDTRNRLKFILPWLEVEQKAPTMDDPWPYTGPIATVPEVCGQRYDVVRLDKFADQIIEDMRKMAVTLVGSQDDGIRVHPSVPIDQPPMVPDVVLDDVVIHFRCGDIMGGGGRGDYGMIKFTEYLKWINKNETKRIGILTQPFDPAKLRQKDVYNAERCKVATYLLSDTLQDFVPDATITIHNGDNETIPLVYARLVMAKQAFISLSSLTWFPMIGTFGHGYFQKGNPGVNPFAEHLPAKMNHLTMMTAPWLSQKQISKKTLNETLKWFITPE
ncbi:unnamed protein product [Cylindrotheca closterium]|uniref:O-fucosyltransferase family protein n=1 Tax=Cylindrotheca closterium TaxID=2856 RepID=A0AAD2JNU9_9STRA|nr:unnamed protein product [Cylindrotheca closterium]